ncbi:MAG: hypothetical protein DA407_08875 [Bacteroidetes bacterium]|nr:MAG: hypothetical protein DA407_08875 [Bacteroidota bacterium]
MNKNFNIKLLKFQTINELSNAWDSNSYKELLDIMEYGDISDISENELKDMCLMCLSDNNPEEAAEIILNYIFDDRLNDGQIENLSNEMLDEKMWEEYADIKLHEEFFNVHQLLYEAYSGKFPHPEAITFQIEISTENAADLKIIDQNTEAILLRLIVKGMPENTLINRLYDEQLETGKFEEAKHIIWQLKKENNSPNSVIFNVVSSSYWFKDFKYAEDFTAIINQLDTNINNN